MLWLNNHLVLNNRFVLTFDVIALLLCDEEKVKMTD